MIIDLQMTAETFLLGIQNELRSRAVCVTKELNTGADTVLLDHFEITNSTVLSTIPQLIQVVQKGATHTVSGSSVLVTQQVMLHFVSLGALQANGVSPTPDNPLFVLPVTVTFALTITLPDGRPHIFFQYRAPADAGALEAVIPGAGQQIDAALANFTGSVPVNINGVDLLVGAPAPTMFLNAGIVVAGGVLTLRLENGTDPDTVTAWTTFYAGAIPSRLNGRSWALFIDKRLLLPIPLEMASKIAGGDFRPSGPPEAEWSGNGHGVHVTQSGVLPDAGPLDEDIDVTFSLDLDFSVPSPDVFVLDASVSASGELSGVVGSVLDFIGISADPGASLPSAAGWTKTGDSSYQLKEYPHIFDQLLGHFAVETVVPDPEGLHLVGSVQRASAVIPAQIQATLQPFKWGVHGSCAKGWRFSSLGYLGLTNTGTTPLIVCETRVLFDPDKQFPVTVQMADSPSSQFAALISVEVSSFQPAYQQRNPPYPCLLLVKTSGGARLVSLGLPVEFRKDQETSMQKERDIRVVNCLQLVDNFWGTRLNPKWIPDPGPDERALHLIQALVRGLHENEQVTLLDGQDRVIARGQAGANGVAYIQSIGSALPGGRKVTLLRTGAPTETRETAAHHEHRAERSVQLRHVLLEPTAELPAATEQVSLLSGRYRGTPVLVVAGRSNVRIYDLRIPSRPAQIDEVAMVDLSSAGLDLAPGGLPAEFENAQYGPTRMHSSGVLVGDVFARLDNASVRIFAPTQVALAGQPDGAHASSEGVSK